MFYLLNATHNRTNITDLFLYSFVSIRSCRCSGMRFYIHSCSHTDKTLYSLHYKYLYTRTCNNLCNN